ncbi:hypothetical protein BJF87_22235 [Gordonia sp. CNJ-863]|uniref:hypothetical protein n=1 Tax=Gordonia sp. CNJ-863 TaxID=1904963 RepID=UPI000969A3F2|nr:hypothetical protein [Gordonia sp. CNJ-863]OLT46643.1 hypothetical protein BJF87_22235 [Gordonia sp. CNJ-863]
MTTHPHHPGQCLSAELVVADILDLRPDDEIDLTGLARELATSGIDLDDPANEHLILTAAEAYTHTAPAAANTI